MGRTELVDDGGGLVGRAIELEDEEGCQQHGGIEATLGRVLAVAHHLGHMVGS